MTHYLFGAAVTLVVSFAVMLRAFGSKHRIENQECRRRTLIVAASVFIASATVVTVLVLSITRLRRTNDPDPPKAPEIAFDDVVNDEETAD